MHDDELRDTTRMPKIAQHAQIVGGPDDGAGVALIDTRDSLLALVVDREGNLSLQTGLNPQALADVLDQISEHAARRAAAWKARQS